MLKGGRRNAVMLKRSYLLIMVAALITVAGCDSSEKQIVGKWKSDGSSGEVIWEFFENGGLSVDGRPGRYTLGDRGRIKIQTQSATFLNQIKVAGDRMTWQAPDGPKQEFTRVK